MANRSSLRCQVSDVGCFASRLPYFLPNGRVLGAYRIGPAFVPFALNALGQPFVDVVPA